MKKIAALLLLLSLFAFLALPIFSTYQVNETNLARLQSKMEKPEHWAFFEAEIAKLKGNDYSKISFLAAINQSMNSVKNEINAKYDDASGKKLYEIKNYQFALMRECATGFPTEQKKQVFWSLFFLTLLGGFLYIFPMFFEGQAGIKNNGVFFSPWLNRGIPGIFLGTVLIVFYVVLYFFPYLISEQIALFDSLKSLWNPNAQAGQWFMYGSLYTIAVFVMGARMFAKYRHSPYQQLRTASIMFFQLVFAFIIPEILEFLNEPYIQFHVAFPLDYSFFFDYRLYSYVGKADWGYAGGSMTFLGIKTGILFLAWGILFSLIGVPVLTYFYGKRWMCSWVCGCGGLAETLGDPFRQQSDKSLKAWKIERYLIYSVLVFSVVMTIFVLLSYQVSSLQGIAYSLRSNYGFLIGSIFSGVIGTGFYPLMGNRMWCRFGCPLAAIMGIVQRYKSRFQITTNGGQCISCGNCSTYCEMGIDVRAYAQKGENIVRASCVGCGICAAVCPRGVLKLENIARK
ncbi:MAG: 4Fe-4S binding protein [Bacteroidia bacterium]